MWGVVRTASSLSSLSDYRWCCAVAAAPHWQPASRPSVSVCQLNLGLNLGLTTARRFHR